MHLCLHETTKIQTKITLLETNNQTILIELLQK